MDGAWVCEVGVSLKLAAWHGNPLMLGLQHSPHTPPCGMAFLMVVLAEGVGLGVARRRTLWLCWGL